MTCVLLLNKQKIPRKSLSFVKHFKVCQFFFYYFSITSQLSMVPQMFLTPKHFRRKSMLMRDLVNRQFLNLHKNIKLCINEIKKIFYGVTQFQFIFLLFLWTISNYNFTRTCVWRNMRWPTTSNKVHLQRNFVCNQLFFALCDSLTCALKNCTGLSWLSEKLFAFISLRQNIFQTFVCLSHKLELECSLVFLIYMTRK